ncbi:Ger(x)C family spore germination protein [Sporohalobacter salinus]|uniref:Ger(x)C family spore germination protein n=1 Tax=Sporohalobacter salinus TaxID=1494606 RepID=UPI001960829F|nr:Ger(x)C family spore germination protein [Sporohalobacter salinus]MBM7623431.1 spore germination protein KC [Sporohalobacter salinus]
MKPAKTITIFLILALVITLSGCWSNREFDTLALVKGVGIDMAQKKDRIKFTVQLTTPQQDSGGGQSSGNSGKKGQAQSVWTTSTTGYSIFEANRNLVKTLGRKPFYPHSEIYIIGEKLARQGIKPYIDFFNRDPEIRRQTYIIIAKGEAENILKAPHEVESIPAAAIKQIIAGQNITGTIHPVDLRKFTISLLSDTMAPVTAAIELKKASPQTKDKSDKKNLIYVSGAAMFKEDKLVAWLTRKETRGLNWIKKPSEIAGPILIKTPNENKKITIEVTEATSNIEPQLKNGKFKMKVEINAKGNITEATVRRYNITKSYNLPHLNNRFAQVIRNEIINALKKSQQYQADIFGFGEKIYNKYPDEFEKIKDNWNQTYANLPVKIIVKANIRRMGLIKKSIATYK